MDRSEWREECEYLATLLETNGNTNVPQSVVGSYLKTQAVNAELLGFASLAERMRHVGNLHPIGPSYRDALVVTFRSVAHALDL
jgi:hypothetical protein